MRMRIGRRMRAKMMHSGMEAILIHFMFSGWARAIPGNEGNHSRDSVFNVAEENNQIARTVEWESNLIKSKRKMDLSTDTEE